ncbi:MAG: hypothetical protein ACD_12C00851G0001 [uncultured bacterium]|nr:MAG: hypothetical protein ACD_12C00851G0001 [uncultured bacterium]
MVSKNNFFDSRYSGMMLSPLCPSCQKEYDLKILDILGESEGKALLYLRCPHCKSACVITASLNLFGLSLIGVQTDLTKDEVIQFKDEKEVNEDDVLEIHERLDKDENFEKELIRS